MALKQLQYRFEDGKTPLSASEFNRRFFDIDQRLHALEQIVISWEEALRIITQHGLKRINELISPTLQKTKEMLEEIKTDWDEMKREFQGEFTSLFSSFQSDYNNWSQEKIEILEQKIITLEQLINEARSLLENGVSTGMIADGAVTTDKIADGSITTAKLSDDVNTYLETIGVHSIVFSFFFGGVG